jgi:uncharacterized protein YbjT (DUF2867 family)
MNLVVFGATGGTGTQLVGQALDADHHVTVIVRDPSKAPAHNHSNLAMVDGDVLVPGTWQAAVAGHDAVLSCLGSTNFPAHAGSSVPWRWGQW